MLQKFKNYKTIASNTFYLSVINVIRMLTPFIALPYVIRVIGSEQFGKIAFAQSIAAFSFILINFGLDISAVKDVSQNRANPKVLSQIVSSVLGVKFCLFLLTAILYTVMVFSVPMFRVNYVLFFITFSAALPEVIFPQWYFQGVERMKLLSLTGLVAVLFYLGTLFIFVREKDDYLFVPMLQIGGTVIAALIGLYMLLKVEKIQLCIPKKAEMLQIFKESIPFFASRVSVVINENIAKIVSGLCLGMTEVAAFELAQKIASACLVPFYMFNQAVYPHNANVQDSKFARKSLLLTIAVVLLGGLCLFLLAPFVLPFFGGNDEIVGLSISTLRCLVAYIIFAAIGVYLGSPTLVAWGYAKPFNRSVYLSTATLLIIYGGLFLTGSFSLNSFALSLAAVELVIASYRFYFCRKYNII